MSPSSAGSLPTWTAPKILAEVQNRKLDLRITVFSNDHDIGILKQCVRNGAMAVALYSSEKRRNPKSSFDQCILPKCAAVSENMPQNKS